MYNSMSARRPEPNRDEGWLGSGLPAKSPTGELQLVVDALNGKWLFSIQGEVDEEEFRLCDRLLLETPPILREIVEVWKASGPNLTRLSRDRFRFRTNVDRYWKARPLEVSWGASGGVGIVHTFSDRHEQTPYEEALRFFSLLIFNCEWYKLGGPCARCGNYYIKKRASQKVYCSRRCGNAATAVIRTRERLATEHKDKLRRAAEAAQKWSRARTRLDWRQWVSHKEPDISVKFLTRAVNNGELKSPTKGQRP